MKQLILIPILLFYCLSSNIARAQNKQIIWKPLDKVEYTDDQTLNLKCITSPSWTVYSFPSTLILPASLTFCSLPKAL